MSSIPQNNNNPATMSEADEVYAIQKEVRDMLFGFGDVRVGFWFIAIFWLIFYIPYINFYIYPLVDLCAYFWQL